MNLSPRFFKNIASNLIGPKGTFNEFRTDCIITKRGEFSFENQKAAKQVKIIKMIRLELIQSPKDNKSIDSNTISLIGLFEELPFELSVDDTSFVFEDKGYTFKSIAVDPAKATITLVGSV